MQPRKLPTSPPCPNYFARLSPLDGRYVRQMRFPETHIFPSSDLSKPAFKVEIEMADRLSNEAGIEELKPFSGTASKKLRELAANFR